MFQDYIFPELYLGHKENEDSSFIDFKRDPSKYIEDLKSIFKYKFLVITSEPGGGKSRLLKEIVKNSNNCDNEAFYLDLKQLDSQSIKTKILSNTIFIDKRGSDTLIASSTSYSTPGFALQNSNTPQVICLDAFDEVSKENQYTVIENIRLFKLEYPDIKIIFSCRDYVYKLFDYLFIEFNIQLAELKPFSHRMVIDFLQKNDFKEHEIDQVITHFLRGWKINLIDNARTLTIFATIKNKEGLEKALTKSKSELLEYFIYFSLHEEDRKRNTQNAEIVKRLLETLALTMEIHQSNLISKDDLMTFLVDVKSNLSHIYFRNNNIEDLFEKSLLIPVENGTKLQFQNAEFQEYLAAKEIARIGKFHQAIYDLAVEQNLREILPSWYNTIKYILELEPSIQCSVVDFIINKEQIINFNIFNLVLLDNQEKINRLSLQEQYHTVSSIINLANTRNKNLSEALCKKLALYNCETNKLHYEYKKTIKKQDYVAAANFLNLSSALMNLGKLDNKNLWKNIYVSVVKNQTLPIYLREISLTAIASFRNINLLRSNFNYDQEKSGNLKHIFISLCNDIDPNSFFTIDMIAKSLTKNDLEIWPDIYFESITQRESIIHLLKLFKNNPELTSFNPYSYEEVPKAKIVINNLDAVYDLEIESLIHNLLINKTAFIVERNLITLLIYLVKKKNPDYIFKLLNYAKKSDNYKNNWFNYNEIFRRLLTASKTNKFIRNFNNVPNSTNALINIFYPYKSSKDIEEQQIFLLSKKYLSSEYEKCENDWKQNEIKWDKSLAIYEQFKKMLSPNLNEDHFSNKVFYFYISHKKEIQKHLTAEDSERIKFCIRRVLKLDLSNAKITSKKVSQDRQEIYFTGEIFLFGHILSLLTEFAITREEYRVKLIEYLPYYTNHDEGKLLFSLIPDINEAEQKHLIKFYLASRKDETITRNIDTLFLICKEFRLISFIPILKYVIENNTFEPYQKIHALETLDSLQSDIYYYKTYFDKYNNDQSLLKVVAKANELLINYINEFQEEAIDWRMNQLLHKPLTEEEKNSHYRSSDEYEMEYQMAIYSTSLNNLNERKYIDKFLGYLDKSIALLRSNDQYKTVTMYRCHLFRKRPDQINSNLQQFDW